MQLKRFTLDSNARRSTDRTALLGGSPFRLFRMSLRGTRVLDKWLSGGPDAMSPTSESERALMRRLVDAGLIHPQYRPANIGPATDAEARTPSVGFVVPVYNDWSGAKAAVAAIRAQCPEAAVVVVDDASPNPLGAIDAITRCHDRNRGPAAARNTGVDELDDCDIVVFVDSDVTLQPGCVELLVAHFRDRSVVACAPRIRASEGPRALDRYEKHASPLDMGDQPAVVGPRSPVPYVPSTVLAVRRAAMGSVHSTTDCCDTAEYSSSQGCTARLAGAGIRFDESMRVGEDVDFVWRLTKAGGLVRYEPAAEARHRNRPGWWALARQRHDYASSAASLETRHPGEVRPLEIRAVPLVAWAAAGLGGYCGLGVAAMIAVTDASKLRARLAELPDATEHSVDLTAASYRHSARWLASSVWRAWLPLFVLAAPFSRRVRRALMASMAASAVFEKRRNLPAGWLDDAAYCSGLWKGAIRARDPRSVLPRISTRSG